MSFLRKIVLGNLAVGAAVALVAFAPTAFGVLDTTQLSQAINAGSLTVNVVSTSVTMNPVTYSHSGQNNQNNAVGNIDINDERGSAAGWTADWTGVDWSGTAAMDYDGNGTTTGQLCVNNPTAPDVTVNAGTDDKGSWSYGADDCFDSGTATINMITTGASKGNGNYTVGNSKVDQFIPGQQLTGSYTTTMTLTVT